MRYQEAQVEDFQNLEDEESPFFAFFGLQEQHIFLRCLRSDEERIEYLRRVAKSIKNAAASDIMIRYRWRGSYAFATAKENQNPFGIRHIRWFPMDSTSSKKGSARPKLQLAPALQANLRDAPPQDVPLTNTLDQHVPLRGRIIQVADSDQENNLSEISAVPDILGESCQAQSQGQFVNERSFFLGTTSEHCEIFTRYNFLFGDTESAALFMNEEKESSHGISLQQIPLVDILWSAKKNMFSLYNDSTSLAVAIKAATTDYLHVLGVVKQVYDELPGATLDVRVLDSPIMATQWVSHLLRNEQDMGCNRETALACITYFETGKSDVSPNYLHDVFAMSSEDSIYISKQVCAEVSNILTYC